MHDSSLQHTMPVDNFIIMNVSNKINVFQTSHLNWGSPSKYASKGKSERQLFLNPDELSGKLPPVNLDSEISVLLAKHNPVSCFFFQIGIINISTFSRAFKEWKFCKHELELLQQKKWMTCPACTEQQHSAHVDGNMKLYRFNSAGKLVVFLY